MLPAFVNGFGRLSQIKKSKVQYPFITINIIQLWNYKLIHI